MAGSWSDVVYRRGVLDNIESGLLGVSKTFTADASAATVPVGYVKDVAGLLAGLDVEFDGTATPDSVTVVVKTTNGITLLTSSALTASGRVECTPMIPFAGGLSYTVTTNTVNSAKATVVALVCRV